MERTNTEWRGRHRKAFAVAVLAAAVSTPVHATYLSRVDILQPAAPVGGLDFGAVVAGKYNNPAGPVAVTATRGTSNHSDSSSVYVFWPNGAGPWQQRSVFSYIPETWDFGLTLEITPQHVIVGLPASSGDDGQVHIYRNVPGIVTGMNPPALVDILGPQSPGSEEFFGSGMDWRADVLAISAPCSENCLEQRVYVYRLVNGAWQPEQVLVAAHTTRTSHDHSTSTDGTRIATNGPDGQTLIYLHTSSGWILEQTIDRNILSGSGGDNEVSIDLDWLAIKSGEELHFFHRDAHATADPWQLVQSMTLPAASDPEFNARLVLRGEQLLLGLPKLNRAEILRYQDSSWQVVRTLTPNGAFDLFGRAVDFGLDLAVVGARNAVYVYRSEVDLEPSATAGAFDANGVMELNVVVTNHDPETRATDTHLSITLPSNLTLAATPPNCEVKQTAVDCRLGQVGANGGTQSLTLPLRATAAGLTVITGQVAAAQPDSNGANDGFSVSFDVPQQAVTARDETTPPEATTSKQESGGGATAPLLLLLLGLATAARRLRAR